MEEIPQDPIHHAEGNVAIHTQMVLEALEGLPEYQLLDAEAKEILWASALLHDIEKASTTVIEDDGRITSKGHAKKGAQSARVILYREIPTPANIREQIVHLVRFHGLPLWIMEKPDPRKALLEASLSVNTEWLYLLAKADALGRICQDQDELLYRLEIFKEFCLENNCWGQPYPFKNGLGRFTYFHKEDSLPDYIPFETNDVFEVIMLSALPGTGKDYFLGKRLKEMPTLSLDELRRLMKVSPTDKKGNGRVVQLAKETAREFLRKKTSFVLNATNITRQMRQLWIDLFVSYGAQVRIIYLEVPCAQLFRQNSQREHALPNAVLERLVEKWEPPTDNEAHYVERHFL